MTRSEAVERWKALCANHNEVERCVLRMAVNPHATPEQLVEACTRYRSMHDSVRQGMLTLTERYPQTNLLGQLPWSYTSLSGMTMIVRKGAK